MTARYLVASALIHAGVLMMVLRVIQDKTVARPSEARSVNYIGLSENKSPLKKQTVGNGRIGAGAAKRI